MQQEFGCTRSGAHLTLTKNWGAHKAVHLTPKTRVHTQRPSLRLTNCPNIHWIVAGYSFSFSPSANPSVSCFNSDTIAPRSRQASAFSGLMAIARS